MPKRRAIPAIIPAPGSGSGGGSGSVVVSTAPTNTGGGAVIPMKIGIASYRANVTAGIVAYKLPAVALLPDGYRVTTWLAISPVPNTNAMSVVREGTSSESTMNPDTGAYQTGAWDTSASGNQQGIVVTWEWCKDGNAWLSV